MGSIMTKAYAGWIKDESIRSKSSSGGVFSALAECVIKDGGVVCGCILDENMEAMHIVTDNALDIDKMRGSKYVQSKKKDVFKEILIHLKSGRKVLFVGAACECAGLKSFVQHSCSDECMHRLILCDFICHGVPSPLIFKDYIDNINKTIGNKIIRYKFRCKDKGWKQSGLQLGIEYETAGNKCVRIYPAFFDRFMCGFLEDIYLRPSCYKCHFKKIPREISDITIADFWGINKVDKRLNDGKGTSLVLTHSRKGNDLLESSSDSMYLKEVDYFKAIKRNPPIIKSARMPAERQGFYSEYFKNGYLSAAKKFMNTRRWFFSTAWRIFGNMIEGIVLSIMSVLGIKMSSEYINTIKQFVQFCTVGVTNVLVSYSINVIMLMIQKPFSFRFDYIVANVSAFVLSVLWSFHWNNRYVFSDDQFKRSKKRTLLKSYATYGFSGIVLNNVLSTIWIGVIGVSKYCAPLLNVPFSMPINFIISKFWTYRVSKR